MPLKTERVDAWYPPLSGITRNIIAERHTLYPYWAISYPIHRRLEIDNVINGGKPTTEKNYTGFSRTLRSRVEYLRYCPLCAAEDIETYGETYWHRQHQLSEMIYCMKHEIRLVDSFASLKAASSKFNPASSTVNLDCNTDTHDNLMPYKDKLLKIGRECEWLIAHGLNVDWSVNGYEKYWRLLRDKGVASFWGKSDYAAMDRSFYEYWGKDFLDNFFEVINIPRFDGWFHKIGKIQVSKFPPLYHILVMCWLTGSVKNFTESNPAETPFGHPPFVCENLICSHYHIDGAEMIRLVDYGSGKAAYFECVHCGLKYKYAKSIQSKEQRVIVDYGRLWNNELRRCCRDPKITNDQTMEILKCGPQTLSSQKKKHGLMKVALYDVNMGPMAYYKAQVLKICQEYDEVTIALLDEKVPRAYGYLQDRDYEWIRSRVVYDNERSFRLERENLLLGKLDSLIGKFEIEGYPDEQLSYGFIASLVGSTRDELRLYRNRTKSKLCGLLDSIIESKKDWRQERIAKMRATNIGHKRITRKRTPNLVQSRIKYPNGFYSARENLLLSKLREVVAEFETEGYPDKQLSYKFIASLVGSTQNELKYKMRHHLELQAFLNEIVEHRGVWRQERAVKLRKYRSKREILLHNAIERVWANPPQEQISRNYIAKAAGLGKDILKDKPYLAELTNGFVESRIDWHKRRFTEAYSNKPVRKRPYSITEIRRAASIDWRTYIKHRELFENMLENFNLRMTK